MANPIKSLTAVLLTALVSLSPARGGPEKIPKPVLVAKGKGYFIHALPNPTFGAVLCGSGLQLLHTATTSGEMKVLASTGSWVGPERVRLFHQIRIVGIASDAERLYVLSWNSGQTRKGGHYSLQTFRLAEGARIYAWPLTGSDVPAAAPAETTDKGPLQVTENGVSCYGTRVSFKGKEPVQVDYAIGRSQGRARMIMGVVKEIGNEGILLTSGLRVVVNAETQYSIETGLDPLVAKLSDVTVGKEVQVVTEQKDGKTIGTSVMVSRLQSLGK